MENQVRLNLINHVYDSFQNINEDFEGSKKIDAIKEYAIVYRSAFEMAKVNTAIVSEIYNEATFSKNKKGLEKIKNNIGRLIIK